MRVYYPKLTPQEIKSKRSFPALMYFHGGGFVRGTPIELLDFFCARFAHELRVVVFNVDYRLAPEHPYPAAVNDSFIAS